MSKIYISGQITGLPIEHAMKNFRVAQLEAMYNYGYNYSVNPFDIRPLFGIKRWMFYMIADVWHQRKCDATAFQSNWMESRGAVIEYFFAKFIFKHRIIML